MEAKKESPEVALATEPEPSPATGLTDRQRTRMEKRDAAVAVPDEDTTYCDNHPDVKTAVVTDGVLHNVQAFCEECAERNGVPVPSP